MIKDDLEDPSCIIEVESRNARVHKDTFNFLAGSIGLEVVRPELMVK